MSVKKYTRNLTVGKRIDLNQPATMHFVRGVRSWTPDDNNNENNGKLFLLFHNKFEG